MHNNLLSLGRMSLDKVGSLLEGELALHKGELLQGLVKGINSDGLVSLWLKGRLIEAATQVKVEAGQILSLLVDEVEDGQIRLKVMTSSELRKSQSETIAARLREMGIPPRAVHVQLARHLLAYNLPINRSNMELMLKGTAILGGANQENINLAAFQLARGFPQHPAILLALAQYTDPASNINSLRQELTRLFFAAPQAETPSPQIGADARAGMPQSTFGLAARPAEAVPAQAQAHATAGSSPPPANMLTAAPEASQLKYLNGIPPADPAPTGLIAGSAELAPAVRGLLSQVLTLIRQELIWQEAQTQQNTTALASQMGEILRRQPELLRGLLLLQNLLEIPVKGGQQALLPALHATVQSLGRELLGQQLMNLAPQPAHGDVPQFYFSFPVRMDGQQRLCEFKVYGGEGQGSLKEREQINVVVSLETPGLGPVVFHLTWYALGQIEMRGVVERPESCRLMSARMPELHLALQDLGYTVRDHGITIAARETAKTTLKVLPEPPAQQNRAMWSRVDIKI